MRWMREAPRPLKLGFETPLSPAARMTAAIKARTAAALAAATAATAEEAVAKEGNPEAEGTALHCLPRSSLWVSTRFAQQVALT